MPLHVDRDIVLPVVSVCLSVCLSRGTGIRGLMRGIATLPQGKQELIVVRDKVGRSPGELTFSIQYLDTIPAWVGRTDGHIC